MLAHQPSFSGDTLGAWQASAEREAAALKEAHARVEQQHALCPTVRACLRLLTQLHRESLSLTQTQRSRQRARERETERRRRGGGGGNDERERDMKRLK